MTVNSHVVSSIRPLILAGGLGTRLRPRTLHLPKPLLPVAGRPILWYALNALKDTGALPPVIVLDYLADTIRAYFDGAEIEFQHLPNRTMAEAVLEVAEKDSARAFLGMSSDVLLPKRAVDEIVGFYEKSGERDAVLFVRLPKAGHKKWEFCISGERLTDIRVRETNTDFERVLLILNRQSLKAIRAVLKKPVTEKTVPSNLSGYQTGWILILKVMIEMKIPVSAKIVDTPVCNINVPADLKSAEEFVASHIL